MIRYIGYACVNETLKPYKFRSIRLNTVMNDGLPLLQEIIKHNLDLTYTILKWNVEHGIYMYRASSDLMPLVTHPQVLELFDWRWYKDPDVGSRLSQIKDFVMNNHIRLSMHPDQYTVLNSQKPEVVYNSITYLEYHEKLLEAMGGQDIILHIGGVYGNKTMAMERFMTVYHSLSEGVKRYLRIENDDKSYNIDEVLFISEQTRIPVVFDYHHHRCLAMPPLTKEQLKRVIDSWAYTKEKIPKMHISSGKVNERDRSHNDYISQQDVFAFEALVEDYTVDVMVEAKKKERATLSMMAMLKANQ